jgi:hypothetical protein
MLPSEKRKARMAVGRDITHHKKDFDAGVDDLVVP